MRSWSRLLILIHFHAIQRHLARLDLAGEILDVQLPLIVDHAHDVEEQVLGADDLNFCHWYEH